MKKYRSLALILLAFAMLLGACAPAATPTAAPAPTAAVAAATLAPTAEPTAEPTSAAAVAETGISLTDGLGRTVTLAAPATSIVSLAPSNTEILYAVGAGEHVIARDDFSNYPEEVADLPSVGGSNSNYSLEQLVSLKPDLVLAAEINTADQVKAMEDLGLTVFYLKNPSDLDGMYANLLTVAELTGTTAEAETLISSLKERVQAVETALANVETRPSVFYELDATDAAAPWTSGPDTFIDTLVGMAGGVNAAAGLNSGWAQMSQESLLVANPDIILLADAAYGVSAEQVAARPGWDTITAVKNSAIYPFNDDLVSRPGPRQVDALEELAKLVHPEAFK
jgi:iron complex transport system substrate-binding protein